MPEAMAVLKFVRITPRKARDVVNMIKGLEVPRALSLLRYTPRSAARIVEKILRSAVANAGQKEIGESDELRVVRAHVDGGPTFRRFRARSMGRANPIHKRTSHITIVVAGQGLSPESSRS